MHRPLHVLYLGQQAAWLQAALAAASDALAGRSGQRCPIAADQSQALYMVDRSINFQCSVTACLRPF